MSRGTHQLIGGKIESFSVSGAIVFVRHQGSVIAIPRLEFLGHENLKIGDAMLYVANAWLDARSTAKPKRRA